MSETRTSEQLINKAAAILGKYVPGEALGDVEHDTLSRAVDDVIAEIAKIVAISDREEIPLNLFETVARMVAIFAAADFSNQPVNLSAVLEHEMRLRYLIAQTPTYEPVKASFF
jgi:hypothetical protein